MKPLGRTANTIGIIVISLLIIGVVNASGISVTLKTPTDGATVTSNPVTFTYNVSAGTSTNATCYLVLNSVAGSNASVLMNTTHTFSGTAASGSNAWHVTCMDQATNVTTTPTAFTFWGHLPYTATYNTVDIAPASIDGIVSVISVFAALGVIIGIILVYVFVKKRL